MEVHGYEVKRIADGRIGYIELQRHESLAPFVVDLEFLCRLHAEVPSDIVSSLSIHQMMLLVQNGKHRERGERIRDIIEAMI